MLKLSKAVTIWSLPRMVAVCWTLKTPPRGILPPLTSPSISCALRHYSIPFPKSPHTYLSVHFRILSSNGRKGLTFTRKNIKSDATCLFFNGCQRMTHMEAQGLIEFPPFHLASVLKDIDSVSPSVYRQANQEGRDSGRAAARPVVANRAQRGIRGEPSG